MTTITHDYPTIWDVYSQLDPKGGYLPLIEQLTKTNELFDYLPVIESNDFFTHRTNVRTGLPAVYYKSVNRGVPPSTATHATVLDPMATLSSLSQIDPEALISAPDKAMARWNLEKAHPIALGNKYGEVFIYGKHAESTTAAADLGSEVLGLAQRYSDPTAGNGDNIISAGGANNDENTSVYVLGLSPETLHGAYPRGTPAGLDMRNLGMQLVPREETAGDGRQMLAESMMFFLRHAVCLPDWRAGVRICNLDVSDFKAQTGTQLATASTHLFKCLSRAIDRVLEIPGVTPVILANQTVKSWIRIAAMEKTTSVLGIEAGLNQFGMPRQQLYFQSVPVLTMNAILNTEDDVAGTVA